MRSASKPAWQQMTALVSLSAGGAITGFSFVPGTAADLTSPASMPIRLLALKQSAQPTAAGDSTLRSAIVNVANYYLRMAEGETPAEMEALIWQRDSTNGADHGPSCAAFASLTLELAAQIVGRQSWVTGGTSYPWPLHQWADVRVDPNAASPGITSVLQDAEAHHRWHPLDDGYHPLPGDWVLFPGHVEVVTKYADGVLHTVGADSLPNFSVNAHEYPEPLDTQGVVGFVNNGDLPGTARAAPVHHEHATGTHHVGHHAASAPAAIPGAPAAGSAQPAPDQPAGSAVIPAVAAAPGAGPDIEPRRRHLRQRQAPRSPGGRPADQTGSGHPAGADVPGTGQSGPAAPPRPASTGAAAIPGLPAAPHHRPARTPAPPASQYRRHRPSPAITAQPGASTQQTFISEVVPGAVASQRTYGVPAAVTIAQAIDESGWGQSSLATRDHNLFGIKGTGPAGSDLLPTQEYENGSTVTLTSPFRVYRNVTESINDHGKLIATSGYYGRAMANSSDPDAFANSLTGVYATDPDYGAKLIDLMRKYDLYRYDSAARRPAAPLRAAKSRAAQPHASPAKPSAAPSQPPVAPAHPAPLHVGPAHPASPHVAPSRQPALPAAPSDDATPGEATIPGLPHASPVPSVTASPARPSPRRAPARGPVSPAARRPPPKAMPATQAVSARPMSPPVSRHQPKIASGNARARSSPYQQHIPLSVRSTFMATARVPLVRQEPLYRDVASLSGISWELLAACDWMQCEAQPRFSPVHGEKLGTVNPDGTVYRTRSEALEQCADDLAELAREVYRIDPTAPGRLSIRELASVFAAFRWGGLLRRHHTSAMEFPYSVAGLTAEHINMRWPNIAEQNTPDKPGGRFRMPFGAVPIVLGLNYPAAI
jgi:flagellum-specific peptidoglycan hydrolase FlgJ